MSSAVGGIVRNGNIFNFNIRLLNENGKTAPALTYLNLVRDRAGLEDFENTDKNLIREQIWKDRRSELAMESKRFFDLVRQERASEVLGDLGFIANKHNLLPIPQNEIDLSKGLLSQNPNW